LVETPDAPLDLIAREVGFSYDAYFVRRFKENLGTTPGAFRAAVKALSSGARREFAAAVRHRLVSIDLSL
jgi:AraC-like DNA-binding protein